MGPAEQEIAKLDRASDGCRSAKRPGLDVARRRGAARVHQPSRYMRVFVEQQGQWRLVATQITRIDATMSPATPKP
jgi:hypothetical protein